MTARAPAPVRPRTPRPIVLGALSRLEVRLRDLGVLHLAREVADRNFFTVADVFGWRGHTSAARQHTACALLGAGVPVALVADLFDCSETLVKGWRERARQRIVWRRPILLTLRHAGLLDSTMQIASDYGVKLVSVFGTPTASEACRRRLARHLVGHAVDPSIVAELFGVRPAFVAAWMGGDDRPPVAAVLSATRARVVAMFAPSEERAP